MTNNFSQTVAFIWSVADLLLGDFKQSQYGRIILPFTLLRCLECVLIVAQAEKVKAIEPTKRSMEKNDLAERMIRNFVI